MPSRGGASDKFGNRYEALWTFDQILRIVDGIARELTLEPLDEDESRGIEFRITNTDDTSDYWSIKRQTAKAAGWTLAVLAARDERGRTILGDLLSHVERHPAHRSVFASTLAARDFEELRAYADSKALLDARLDRASELKSAFRDYLLPLCGGDAERARAFLLRTRTHAADEAQLRGRVDFAIRKLLYSVDGSPLNVAAVRGYLADLLLDNIHRPLNQDAILDALAAQGVRRRDWAVERSVRDRIDAICETYTAPLQSQLINGTFLPLAGAASAFNADGRPVTPKVLLVGGAGGGKSSTLAAAAERLRGAGVPVLPIRFDQLPEGIVTTAELGRKLLLPESPVLVLAGVADGGP